MRRSSFETMMSEGGGGGGRKRRVNVGCRKSMYRRDGVCVFVCVRGKEKEDKESVTR